MSALPVYVFGDSSEVRRDIAALVIERGSLRQVAADIKGISVSYLSAIMREKVPPSPLLLDYLGYERILSVKYVRKS